MLAVFFRPRRLAGSSHHVDRSPRLQGLLRNGRVCDPERPRSRIAAVFNLAKDCSLATFSYLTHPRSSSIMSTMLEIHASHQTASPAQLSTHARGDSDSHSEKLPVDAPLPVDAVGTKRGSAFWLVFFALAMATFLSALDLTAVSTALPVIAEELREWLIRLCDCADCGADMTQFSWTGSAYALASTVFLPLYGSFAHAFGVSTMTARRIWLMQLNSVVLFYYQPSLFSAPAQQCVAQRPVKHSS